MSPEQVRGQETDRRTVIAGPRHEFAAVWTPDDRHILFTSRRGGNGRQFRHASDGSGAAERPLASHREPERRLGTRRRELFFLDPSGRLNGARVRTAPGFASEPARPIGSMTYYRGDGLGQFDVPLDGRQFLMIKNLPDAKPPNNPILVLLNALPRGASR